jgi:hypothetical protein
MLVVERSEVDGMVVVVLVLFVDAVFLKFLPSPFLYETGVS